MARMPRGSRPQRSSGPDAAVPVSRRRPRRLWLGAAGALALVLVIVAGLLLTGSPAPAPVAADPGLPYPEVARITLTDAKAALDAGDAVFVDVRGEEQYAEAHIPGALSLPLLEIEQRAGELSPDAELILYCT